MKEEDTDDRLSELKKTGEHLSLFNHIAKALTSKLDEHAVAKAVMEQIASILTPSHWSLVLHDEETGQFYYEIAIGEGCEGLVGRRFTADEGPVGVAVATGEAQVVDTPPLRAASLLDRPDYTPRNIIALPLRSHGKVFGVIEIVDAINDDWKRENFQALKAVADFSAIALENARNFAKVKDLTIIDEHTGLFNARHLREVLDSEINRSARYNHNVSLLFIDLDHFKNVNDTHGHLVGSALLKEVGKRLKNNIRKVDSAYRYGGDEFAIILVETPKVPATVVARRIKAAFDRTIYLEEQRVELALTASIGIASFPVDASDTTSLIRMADLAMYQAKAKGRNEVCTTDDLPAMLGK